MGLDQYVYKIRKAKLEDRTYTRKELSALGLSYVSAEDAHADINLYANLLPYTTKRNVSCELYDVEKIITDYNLPSNSRIGAYSYERIELFGKTENGESVSQIVTRDDIESKYTKIEIIEHYIWTEEEEAYWRKNYDLQDWIYDTLDNVDNTKYCILDAETIKEINSTFDEYIYPEDPTNEYALFYWEWY